MATNASVILFRRLTEDMQKAIHAAAVAELNQQAEILKEAIANAAPVYSKAEGDAKAGVLKASVMITKGRKDTIVNVQAGGPTTTRSSGGKPFDYARAVEFGTQTMKAQPFFFNTYRRMRRGIRNEMRLKIAIEVNKYSAE